ncbi:hypothetical protein PISL3812_03509 [Talaromyces islandicus]|uniref:Glycerate dehydrogenase n=1 Tax=Talaromyces islandicus TaxID=28573 RepID=A0A0U1LSX0_TALIS|nr:hypothetical protein PISL3812_03509 [Talaromyces islandicus]
MSTKGRPSMAVLDDYLNITPNHLKEIPPEKVSVTVFQDALPSYTHPQTSRDQKEAIVERLKPYTVISTMRERTPFPGDLLRQLPNLKLLLATGTQFETFDLAAARELGITVAAAPGKGRTDGKRIDRPLQPRLDIKKGGSHPTTQHAWALILSLARNVANDDAAMKDATRKGWQTQLAKGLTGATLGVVGLGRLGAAVARIGALAWGMKVLCWSENLTQEKANQKAEEMGLPAYGGGPNANAPTFTAVSKEELFRNADVVTLHYVLSDRSRGIVGAKELELMKSSALLVNTSRGGLIDDMALYDVLHRGRIGGAALDVFDVEPLPADSLWRSPSWGQQGRSNLLITPHMGYVEEGIMHTWYEETVENVERWIEGKEILHRLV